VGGWGGRVGMAGGGLHLESVSVSQPSSASSCLAPRHHGAELLGDAH
jgi:hypothetical protein